jgi:DNA repair exonuclease SbcCD ATPase subunit
MIVTDITIKNFLSFGDVHCQLPPSGLVLVTGWDEDLGRSNGAGKSTLFHALSWCIYGELPKDIKVEELIRRGEKSCSVTVIFAIDSVQYTVTRKRPSSLEFTIGNEKQKGNPKYLQALIEQTIGLSYKQFLITSYFPQKGDSSRFIKQNDSMAKDFLSTILSFNKTEQAYKKLHLELKELETKVAAKAAELSTTEASIERFSLVADMSIPPMPSREEVGQAKKAIEEVEFFIANPPDTSTVDAEIARVQAAVEKVRAAKYSVSSWESSIAEKQRRIDHLNQGEAHYLTWPSCEAELLESSGKLVHFDEQAAEDVKARKIAHIEEEIADIRQKLEKVLPLVDKETALQDKLSELSSKRMQARHDYDMAVQKRSHLASQMASFKQAVIASQQAKQQKDKIAVQLLELQTAATVKAAELALMSEEVMILAAAKSVMSPTGAIAYSLDSVMIELNNEVGQYLDVFSHNTMTYKLTSGEDKAKVTHTITKSDADVSVGSLSGGEERGLILSVDLGLSEVIASRSGVNLPSVLMLDECFEGLDYIGKERVIDALREVSKDRCIIVIDHSTEFNALFDKSIKVLKKNDVSRLEIT